MKMKRLLENILLSLLAITVAVSCVDESSDQEIVKGDGSMVLSFGTENLLEIETKSTLGTSSESKIFNFYLFLFDSDGNKVFAKWYDSKTLVDDVSASTDSYCWSVSNSSSPVTGKIKLSASKGKGMKIYMFSNIDADMLNVSSDLISSEIHTEDDLKNFKATMLQTIVTRNGYFPMSGKLDGVTITSSGISTTSGSLSLKLYRLDAKIKFIFKFDPSVTNSKGQSVKTFTAKQWKVVNVPRKEYVLSYDLRGVVGKSGNDAATQAGDFFSTPLVNFEEHSSATEASFSFYMPENRMTPKGDPSSYGQRSKQVKDDSGLNTVDADGSLEFKYADNHSAYVVVTGDLEMNLAGDEAGQVLGANVKYLIHLGDFSKGDWSDYNVQRNTFYTYTVTVKGVDDIKVEVETNEENSTGATGNVTIAKEVIAVCDAHYVSKTMSFYAKNIDDAMTWYVKTPFCEGGPQLIGGEMVVSGLDYKWIHFRTNYLGLDGEYSANRRAYTPTAYVLNADGTDNDGIMDVIQLVSYMRRQKALYEAGKASEFDGTSESEGGPKINVTAFIDEFYYDANPVTGTKSDDLWKSFVNKDDRCLHILTSAQYSQDNESSITGSVVTIQQKSIRSIYNTAASNTALKSAWGVEIKDENADIWRYNESADKTGRPNTTSENRGNSDLFNGRLNSVKEWNLCNSNSTTFNDGGKWSDYMDTEVSNEESMMDKDHRMLRYSCMERNRDNNGNGVIDRDEVRWYMASVRQLVGLYIGADLLSASEKLYNRDADQKASPLGSQWRQHVVSSTWSGSNSNLPTIVWAEEGSSTGALTGSWDHTGNAIEKWSLRCVRNLGMGTDPVLSEMPQDYIECDKNSDGSYTFTNTFLNEACMRYYSSRELDADNELSEQNKVYKSFVAAPVSAAKSFSSQSAKTINDYLDATISGNPYCPAGYRLPNLRELSLMALYASSLLSNNTPCRTYWSMGPYGSAKWPRGYFWYGANVYLETTNSTTNKTSGVNATTARCVKDVLVSD